MGGDIGAGGRGGPTWAGLHNRAPEGPALPGPPVGRLLAVANAVGFPAPRILADVFAMGATETFLEIETLADVVTELLVGTHPKAVRDKSGQVVLQLSLFDVFDDLKTVGPRFGASGASSSTGCPPRSIRMTSRSRHPAHPRSTTANGGRGASALMSSISSTTRDGTPQPKAASYP